MKEYHVIIATGAKHVEDALNMEAAEGFEFCGFVPSKGGNPLIIMEREMGREMPRVQDVPIPVAMEERLLSLAIQIPSSTSADDSVGEEP